MIEGKLSVRRTAHYYIAGRPDRGTRKVWIVLHGYGQLAGFFIRKFDPLVQRGDCVVAPEGLSSYYVEGVTGRVGASWMTKNNRADEISDYLHYLDELYDFLCREYGFSREVKINVLGFSQGVAVAARWACFGKIPVDKLIFWCGTLPKDELPVEEKSFSTYFIYGLKDEYLTSDPPAQVQLLGKHFTPFEVKTFNDGHEITADHLTGFADIFSW